MFGDCIVDEPDKSHDSLCTDILNDANIHSSFADALQIFLSSAREEELVIWLNMVHPSIHVAVANVLPLFPFRSVSS